MVQGQPPEDGDRMTLSPAHRVRPFPAARRAILALALVVLAACAAPSPSAMPPAPGAEAIRVASWNLHYVDADATPDPDWTPAAWQARRGALERAARALDADLLALQEIEVHDGARSLEDPRLGWLLAALPGHRAAAARFAGGVTPGQPILYRASVFALLDEGFAFYDDPDASFQSLRAFAGYPDAVTWARLRHRASGRALAVFNVHFHFLDAGQRLRSAGQVLALAQAAQARGDAVIVLGDFNARRNSRTLEMFRAAGFRRAGAQGATFHFNTGLHLFGAIDHVLHDGATAPAAPPVTWRGGAGGRPPSDHYPVLADLRLSAPRREAPRRRAAH
jgi:endonuclease/exonuclease/phosphatase family metal-dependent hydrolase